MTNAHSNPNSKNPKYDLEERTIRFSRNLIDFLRKIQENTLTRPIINQLIRSGTSIGANYHEADEANSKKDFINKIAIAKKETKETRYWLRLLDCPIKNCKEKETLIQESIEFAKIFGSILEKCK